MMRQTRKRLKLTVELLEERMNPSWGSIPPSLISPPRTFTSVTLNSAGDATGNASITSNENDWYRFTARNTGTYTFEATTPTSTLDTVMATYTTTGSRRAYNDDISSSNTDSRYTLTLTAGQVLFFGVTNYTGTAGGTYTWRVDGPADAGTGDDAYELNNTRATAFGLGTLTSPRTLSNLVMADGNDWYSFTTSFVGGTADNVTTNFLHSNGDLELELYNASGTRLFISESGDDNEEISLNGLAAGTYFVRVFGYNGANNPSYSLTVTPPATGGGGGGGGTSAFQVDLRMTGLTSSQQTIFRNAAARWSQVITGDLPAANYNGINVDDVLIDASSITIDGRGGVLGQAGPDRFRTGSGLPFHGVMQFDTADLASLESSGGLFYTVMHEMGHVLGVGTLWRTKGLIIGAGTSNPVFTGAQAVAEYNRIFANSATGVPVENSGGSGTRDAHWRETIFGRELMTGYLNSGVNPLSRITAASLADMGYQVNINAADSYSPSGGSNFSGGGSGGGAALRLASFNKAKITTNLNEFINYLAIETKKRH